MKTKKAKLRSKADRLWFEKCFIVYGRNCEVCGKPAAHIHHYFPKGLYGHLRYDIVNGVPLCFHCHFNKTHKADPLVHEIIQKKRGKKWLKDLEKKAKVKPPPSYLKVAFYENIIKELTK